VGPQGATGAQGTTGNAGTSGQNGSTGPTGPAGPTGATGATGQDGTNGTNGTNGATGATGPAGAGGHVANFMSSSNVPNGECIGNIIFASNNHGGCPSAVTANTFTSEVTFLEGPVPAGGGTVTNLEAVVNTAPTGTQSHTVTVLNNTTGATLLSCSITAGNTSCQSTASGSVPAGHYLQVRINNVNGASSRQFRVTFRY
jgi:hypothetical protein